jgi:lysophospholipase L1-like esterase
LPAASVSPQTLGVLAFGDSITNGGGELQWGVALQSWALWTARGLGLPYSGYAFDGARVDDVLGVQIPRFQRATPHPEARYDLGCLYIGVNDVRALDWDLDAFTRDFATALSFLSARCERTLSVTAPLDLGRPRAGAKVADLNVAIECVSRAHGALVLDLSDFRARNHVMADHVHPTAFGQIAIAERALSVLARDGMRVAVAPHELILYEVTRPGRLRAELAYCYRHAKVSLRALALALGAWRWRRFWE